MIKFNDEISEEAINSMKRLMRHPISHWFSIEWYPKSSPILEVILKLRSHEYNLVIDWLKDVEIIWATVEKKYKQDSDEAALAREMRYYFEKETKFLSGYILSEWCALVYHYRISLANLTNTATPKNRKQIVPWAIIKTPIDRPVGFTFHELQSYQLALQMVSTKQQIEDMNDILINDNISTILPIAPISLNFELPHDSTLFAIRDYLKKSLAAQKLNFLSE